MIGRIARRLRRRNLRQYEHLKKRFNRTKSEFIKKHILAYSSWRAMHNRISNPKHPAYHNYGGSNLHICERWDDFLNFVEDMGDPPIIFGERLTLERKDNNLVYNKDNCKWATRKEQQNNQRIKDYGILTG